MISPSRKVLVTTLGASLEPAVVMGPGLRRDDSVFVVTPVSNSSTLQNITGTIALAGAGKMGGAMLTGWLAGGLDAKRVVVIEPMPSAEINALAAKGIRLNPKDAGAVETLVSR